MSQDFIFSCNNCIFKETSNDRQVGCSLDMPTKLLGRNPEASDLVPYEDSQVFTFDRFCMTYRPPEWVVDHQIEGDPKMAVLKELRVPVGYVIAFSEDLETLKTTLDSIEDPIYVIVTNNKVEYNEGIYNMLGDRFPTTPYRLVQLLKKAPYQQHLDRVFSHCKNGWITLIKAGYTLPADFYSRIKNRVNVESRGFAVCFDDNKEKLVVQSKIFKFLGGNMPMIRDDLSVDKRDFYERLEEAKANTTNQDLIVSWKEMFDED